jgi:hypothetical protein
VAKGFDPQLLTKTVLTVAQDIFGRQSKVQPTDPPTSETHKLIEYQGRMSVNAMKKFNSPAYISGISFYLTPQDKEKHKAVGVLVLYIEASNAEKLLKSFGYTIGEDEEDEEVVNACGKLCTVFAEGLKNELKKANFPELILGAPVSEKNSLTEGVEFGSAQTEKQEISFNFWKKKTLVLDVVLSNLTAR